MTARRSKICALVLALAMMPGAVELMENAAHLATEGHLAHAAADGDRHEPADPEHGCTSTFHLCGCHAGLAFLVAPRPPAIDLREAGFSSFPASSLPPTGFWSTIDRPPRV